jgi:hypothetical protein
MRVSHTSAQDPSSLLLLIAETDLLDIHQLKPKLPSTPMPNSLPPIGTTVLYKGRACRFRGLTPVSIQPARALLEDLRTSAWYEVASAEIQHLHTIPPGRRP